MAYVLDTHTLVWYFTEDKRLSQSVKDIIEKAEQKGSIIIPIIVLAEIMHIHNSQKIPISFNETLERILENKHLVIAILDENILKVANNIEYPKEMHDKIIVATAKHYNSTLITKDKEIKNSGLVPVIW